MLTNEQIEAIARAYCAAIGADPDMTVGHGYGDTMTASEKSKDNHFGSGMIPAIALYSPQWMLMRPQVEREWAIRKAFEVMEVSEA